MAVMAQRGSGREWSSAIQVGVLFHRQRVHVGAQANALATAAFALSTPTTRCAKAAMELDAPLVQFVGHDADV